MEFPLLVRAPERNRTEHPGADVLNPFAAPSRNDLSCTTLIYCTESDKTYLVSLSIIH